MVDYVIKQAAVDLKLPMPAGGRFVTIGGSAAIEDSITVRGEGFDIALSYGAFDKSRNDQANYATDLGYRLATRDEHLAYVRRLLENEGCQGFRTPGMDALMMYRSHFIRDAQGRVTLDGQEIKAVDMNENERDPVASKLIGALFVRACRESQG